MNVQHPGCSQERVDAESASLQYPVSYSGIALCAILGVATVALSLFLFAKLIVKVRSLALSKEHSGYP